LANNAFRGAQNLLTKIVLRRLAGGGGVPMHRLDDAEAAYKEDAVILRELAAQNPVTYRPNLAGALNNLALLYREMHRDSDAKAIAAELTAATK
jgi:hypothetical protein